MTLPFVQIDAFTSRPFAGNPAAVCLLPEPRDAVWMQNVALEMNLSETAFLVRREDGYDLRWFTPAVEVDLCGHATLASAHFLFEDGHLQSGETARFHSRSGLLTARQVGGEIELDFPAHPVHAVEPPAGLVAAVGGKPHWVGFDDGDYYLLAYANEAEVRALEPDFVNLARHTTLGAIATAAADGEGLDFVSRMFAPAAGIDEDPVTGSAHCTLATYWAERLGKSKMQAFQASTRGGEVGVELAGERVRLRGRALTVLRGELLEVAC